MTADTSNSTKLPSAARRGGAALLTAGFIGAGLTGAAHADEEEFTSSNPVPLQASTADEADGYGPDADLEDSDEDRTSAGDYFDDPETSFWEPEPVSQLLGSQDPGNQPIGSSAETETGLFAGQSLRYEVQIDLTEYEALYEAHDGEDIEFQLRDRIPSGVSVDLDSIEFHSASGDHGGGSLLEGDEFSAEVRGDNNDLLIISDLDDWLAENVIDGELSTLYLSFDASVSGDAELHQEPESAPFQRITVPEPAEFEEDEDGETGEQTNAGETDVYEFFTEPVSFQILGADPAQSLSDTSGDAVGDRVAVGGDRVAVDVTLDGTLAGEIEVYDEENDETNVVQDHTAPAYDISDFGLVDTFDPDLLQVDADSVTISDAAGDYDVEVDNDAGELRIFVDDPEAWLGSDYTVSYGVVVQDTGEDGSAAVETTQVIDDNEFVVEDAESVSVSAISPEKSAVSIVDGEVTELEEIAQNEQFFYGVTNSETPENALYPLQSWGVSDVYTSGDRALHENWEVRADVDIADSEGDVVFEAGAVIADASDTTYFEKRPEGDSFDLVATNRFTELVGTSQSQWTAYVGVTRTAEAGGEVSNTANEVRNGYERQATLTTGTSEAIVIDPALDVADTVEQGETLEVSGSGFTPGGDVELDFGAETPVTADEDGTISAQIEVSEDAETGERELAALDVASEESVSATVEVTEAESDEEETELALSAPAEADQGETIEVSGSGFTGEGEVEVSLNPEETFTADEDGEFSGELTIPEDAETGERELTALDVASEESVSAELEILAASTEEEEEEEGNEEQQQEEDPEEGQREASQREEDPEEGTEQQEEEEGSEDPEEGTEEQEEEEEETAGGSTGTEPTGVSGSGSEAFGGTGSGEETWSGQEETPAGGSAGESFDPTSGSEAGSVNEQLARTGVSAPWLIGGSALLLMVAGAGALAANRIRTTGSLFGAGNSAA